MTAINDVARWGPTARAARLRGTPLVALESSVLAQGLPIPANRAGHDSMLAAVRHAGAEGVVVAVVDGEPTIGLEGPGLERFLARDGVDKVTARDLATAVARRRDGATTVAATLALCTSSGLSVFATGGIGGVHREPAFDESADLMELARSPVAVVCAGAKSVLDLPATLERLESYGVTVVGYRTDEFPGFLTATTGLPVPVRVESVSELAGVVRASRALNRSSATLIVQPPPPEVALSGAEVEAAVGEALTAARTAGIRGAAVTPFLLGAVESATQGRSLAVNLALLESNAALAGALAVELARSAP